MNSIFDMSDLGNLNYYLGIEVKQEEDIIVYARKILKETVMSNCNPTKWPMDPKLQLTKDEGGKEVDPTKYRRIIGSLRYLINTRPDLSYSVGVKQQTVALISCEAAFMAATAAACQALWLRNMQAHRYYHFIRECVERDQIYVEHVSGDLQQADILTKALPRIKFTEMRRLIGTEDVNIKGENVD
nr:zinc finger, CCHC-type [Tanacetum cinerariifolium]